MDREINRRILTDVIQAHGAYCGIGYPFLLNNRWASQVTMEIIDGNGVHWGGYELLILFPTEYPYELPLLYELEGRIKFTASWHRNSDLSCCIGPWVTEMMKYNGEVNFLDWMNRSAYPYLANHFHKERHGHYINGEYPHDLGGIAQAYMELWGVSLTGAVQRLELVTKAVPQSSSAICFCGSGKPYRKCHDGESTYNGIPRAKFNDSLKILKWYQRKQRA